MLITDIEACASPASVYTHRDTPPASQQICTYIISTTTQIFQVQKTGMGYSFIYTVNACSHNILFYNRSQT